MNKNKMARRRKKNLINQEQELPKTKNQQLLTVFILVFPVLLLAMVGLTSDLLLRIFLFIYEAVLVKNFVDDYFGNKA